MTTQTWDVELPDYVDIDPSPAILQVLGDVEMEPWRCFAEFVDNSVDSFLSAQKAGGPIKDPRIRIGVSGTKVTVEDNGPGMSWDEMTSAVKTGWSSHDHYGSLGLYGVGFNIACARLGHEATLWTTKQGQQSWVGLRIDIPALRKKGTFRLEKSEEAILRRPKSNPDVTGTLVEVSRIKSQWDNFQNTSWVNRNVRDKLARVYGTMLIVGEPILITITLGQTNLKGWEYVCWPEETTVYRKWAAGQVSPFEIINMDFGSRFEHRNTREIVTNPEAYSPSEIIEIPRKVYGWIGIQRYLDTKDYGIDLLRNGRKIEVACKDFFEWDGELEYPIDDVGGRGNQGRIVGEVHFDHGWVPYNKKSFDRDHVSWRELLTAIRGNEAITNRPRFNLKGSNDSPLGRLHRAFRRRQPDKTYKNPGKDWLIIKDNAHAVDLAKHYRKGDPDYLTLYHWDKALKESDKQPQKKGGGKNGGGGGGPLGPTGGTGGGGTGGTQAPVYDADKIDDLSFSYSTSSSKYDFASHRVKPTSNPPLKAPWLSRATAGGVYEIYVDPGHEVFESASFGIEEAVLTEMAFVISSEENAKHSDVTHGEILASLRGQHIRGSSLNQSEIRDEIRDLLIIIGTSFEKLVSPENQDKILGLLPEESQQRLKLAKANVHQTQSVGKLLSVGDLAQLVKNAPETVLRLTCFRQQWNPPSISEDQSLVEAHQKRFSNKIAGLFENLAGFLQDCENQGATDLRREETFFARASLNALIGELR